MNQIYITYRFLNIKIKFDSKIFYTDVQAKLIKMTEKVLRAIPRKVYTESLVAIIVGEHRIIPSQNSSIYYKNSIYISPYFLATENPIVTYQNILVHELGHAFVDGWHDNLFYNDQIKEDFISVKEKLKEKIPEFPKALIEIYKPIHKDKIEKWIRSYGEGEIMAKAHELLRSAYEILSIDEFIAYNFEEFYVGSMKKVEKKSKMLYDMLKNINTREGI